MKNFYLNKGYYDVVINSSFAKLIDEKDSSFELIYNINANQKYSFNDITLDLPIDFEKENFQDILNLFSELKGKTYSLYIIENILDEMIRLFLMKNIKLLSLKLLKIFMKIKLILILKLLKVKISG